MDFALTTYRCATKSPHQRFLCVFLTLRIYYINITAGYMVEMWFYISKLVIEIKGNNSFAGVS